MIKRWLSLLKWLLVRREKILNIGMARENEPDVLYCFLNWIGSNVEVV
jgi:hypothetical protein